MVNGSIRCAVDLGLCSKPIFLVIALFRSALLIASIGCLLNPFEALA